MATAASKTGNAAPPRKHSKLILLGAAGGPVPKAERSALANAIVIGIGDVIYIIDCRNSVAPKK